jgi:hypothetical protein
MEGSKPAPRRRRSTAAGNGAGAAVRPTPSGEDEGAAISPTPSGEGEGAATSSPVSKDGEGAATSPTPSGEGEGAATSFLQRVPLRRRLQYLRRRREVALRDLGGFVFETHRQGEERPELLAEKLGALDAIDEESGRLEQALHERREVLVLREPGISACPECSTLHGSEANYCPNCGTAVGGAAKPGGA